ncbi:hypothetical protein Tco_1273900 [Tanacetum coccineum]
MQPQVQATACKDPVLFTVKDDDESETYTSVHFINSRDRPWTTLMAIGFGYGANMLTEYLAEVGEDTQTSYQDAAIELGKECVNNNAKHPLENKAEAEGELTGNKEAINLILDNVCDIEKRGQPENQCLEILEMPTPTETNGVAKTKIPDRTPATARPLAECHIFRLSSLSLSNHSLQQQRMFVHVKCRVRFMLTKTVLGGQDGALHPLANGLI